MNQLWTISELSKELGVTARAIRFYEDKTLIKPQRVGANRVYSYKDRARLKLILRGKRLGFSLEEIGEYIDLYDANFDPMRNEQLAYLLNRVRDRAAVLRKRQRDLQEMLSELKHIEDECLSFMKTDQRLAG